MSRPPAVVPPPTAAASEEDVDATGATTFVLAQPVQSLFHEQAKSIVAIQVSTWIHRVSKAL